MCVIYSFDYARIPNLTPGKSIPEKIQNVTKFQMSPKRFQISEKCDQMIKSTLKYKPEERFSIKQVLESEYVKEKCRNLGWDLQKLMRFRKLRSSHNTNTSMNTSVISDVSGFTRQYDNFQQKHNPSLFLGQSSEGDTIQSGQSFKEVTNFNLDKGNGSFGESVTGMEKSSYEKKKHVFKKRDKTEEGFRTQLFEEKRTNFGKKKNMSMQMQQGKFGAIKEDAEHNSPNWGKWNQGLANKIEENTTSSAIPETGKDNEGKPKSNSKLVSDIETRNKVNLDGLEMDYSQVNLFENEVSDEDFEEKFFQDQLDEANTGNAELSQIILHLFKHRSSTCILALPSRYWNLYRIRSIFKISVDLLVAISGKIRL